MPFGAIFIEMYFVFTAFWNYKFYYVYGFMALVFIILTIVIVCVTIGESPLMLAMGYMQCMHVCTASLLRARENGAFDVLHSVCAS